MTLLPYVDPHPLRQRINRRLWFFDFACGEHTGSGHSQKDLRTMRRSQDKTIQDSGGLRRRGSFVMAAFTVVSGGGWRPRFNFTPRLHHAPHGIKRITGSCDDTKPNLGRTHLSNRPAASIGLTLALSIITLSGMAASANTPKKGQTIHTYNSGPIILYLAPVAPPAAFVPLSPFGYFLPPPGYRRILRRSPL